MKVVPAEEEVEAEVRREDQNNINRFARLNARLHELRAERALIEVSFVEEGCIARDGKCVGNLTQSILLAENFGAFR